MYDLIYNFLLNNIFSTTTDLNLFNYDYNGMLVSMPIWLSHTTTIILMILLVVCGVKLVLWFFKLGANLIRLK